MSDAPSFLRHGSARASERNAAWLSGTIACQSIAQVSKGEPWRLLLLHDRPTHALIWITRGQGRVILNGVRRGVGAHNALVIPAGTLFSLELGPQALGQVIESPAGLTGRMPRDPMHLRVRDALAQAELTAELEAMQREISQNRPLVQEALTARLGLISVWVQRQFGAGSADTPRETAGQRLARRFSERVAREFRSDKAMGAYAEDLEVTPTHLTRICRECCGKTAADILTERRVYEARLLLSQPGPAIKDVARHLGFHSAAYFTRFMQQHTGLTPTLLRRNAQSRSR
ncbi:MAG: AraC family transcriptional regulator [Rhodobacteraceae bacterium]|nr:AraC family transcriptional regulator [Paracoccaceae bacterium]